MVHTVHCDAIVVPHQFPVVVTNELDMHLAYMPVCTQRASLRGCTLTSLPYLSWNPVDWTPKQRPRPISGWTADRPGWPFGTLERGSLLTSGTSTSDHPSKRRRGLKTPPLGIFGYIASQRIGLTVLIGPAPPHALASVVDLHRGPLMSGLT